MTNNFELFEMYNLKHMSLSAELFLSCSILQLTFYAIGTSYQRKHGYIILSHQIYNIAVLILAFTTFLYINEDLFCLNYLTSNNCIVNDYLAYSSKLVICLVSLLFLIIIKISYKDELVHHNFEYIILCIISILGLLLLCSSNDLITAYLSIELQSIAFYIMASFKKNSSYSIESGLKYFIIGSLSSAFFLFGSSFIYGCLGSLNFDDFKMFLPLINEKFSDIKSTDILIQENNFNQDYFLAYSIIFSQYFKKLFYSLKQIVYLSELNQSITLENYFTVLSNLNQFDCNKSFFSTGVFETLLIYKVLPWSNETSLLDWSLDNCNSNESLFYLTNNSCSWSIDSFYYKITLNNFFDNKFKFYNTSYEQVIDFFYLNTNVFKFYHKYFPYANCFAITEVFNQKLSLLNFSFYNIGSCSTGSCSTGSCISSPPDFNFCNFDFGTSPNSLFISNLCNITNKNVISDTLSYNIINLDLVFLGFMLVCISIFIKLALAPFHFWSLDVYEGSPNTTTFFFTVIPKIGLFVFLIRICYSTFHPSFFYINNIINNYQFYFFIFAFLSIFIGSLGGLEQRKLKSLLAYSSISHTGYLLLSFSTLTSEGIQMLLYYLVIYMLAGLCFWAVYLFLNQKKDFYFNKQNKELGDLVLLRDSNPTLAVILSLTLFSMAGIPPIVGFLAKLGIFLNVLKSSFYLISVISILLSVISTFYYIRFIKVLYFENVLVGKLYIPISTNKALIVSILSLFLILLCIDPIPLYLLFHKAMLLLNS